MRIHPARSFRGRFHLPGDKSISHRAAILGAMAEGETRIHNFASAADCASSRQFRATGSIALVLNARSNTRSRVCEPVA